MNQEKKITLLLDNIVKIQEIAEHLQQLLIVKKHHISSEAVKSKVPTIELKYPMEDNRSLFFHRDIFSHAVNFEIDYLIAELIEALEKLS